MTNDAAAVARARSIAGLTAFVALLVVLAFVVETLSQIGVSSKILVWLVAGFCLAVPAVVAIAARTICRANSRWPAADARSAKTHLRSDSDFRRRFRDRHRCRLLFSQPRRDVGVGVRAVRQLFRSPVS